MRVEYLFPRDGEEADIEIIKNKDNNTIKIVVTPYFYKSDAAPNVCYVRTVTEEGDILHREAHRASGRSGKIGKQVFCINKRVAPKVDDTKKEAPNVDSA